MTIEQKSSGNDPLRDALNANADAAEKAQLQHAKHKMKLVEQYVKFVKEVYILVEARLDGVKSLAIQRMTPGKRPIGELVIRYLNRTIMLIPMDVEREVLPGCFGLLNIVADQRQLDEAFAMAGESIEKYEVQLLSKDQGIPKFDRLTPDRLSELLMRLLNPKAGG